MERSHILVCTPALACMASRVVLDPAPGEVTWQIGAIQNGAQELGFDFVCLYFAAGVTPFVVAGIEFSKIIIVQKRCEVCGGSGLVLREKEKDYLRCPECAYSFCLEGIGSCLRVLIEDPVPANSLESALSSFSPSLLCQKASFQPGGHKPMLSSFSPESPLIT
ncbi:hypothetical protein HKD37_16G046188 [Glycine soja]